MTPEIRAFDLARFKAAIRARCGLSLEGLAEDTLTGAIAKRMAIAGVRQTGAYFDMTVARDDEFQELVSLITVNETYFYREPEQFALLADTLVPRLLAEESRRLPLRILSAGCSSGEEPYSIAIALRERFGEAAAGLVAIVGGDIDRHALAKAQGGRYSKFSFRGLPAQLGSRYFTPLETGQFTLAEQIRAMVRFVPLNLLSDEAFAGEPGFDIVFYRNVSIYFDASTRRRIQRHLYHAMAAHGILLMGLTETIANDFGIFRQVETDGMFYFVKAPPQDAPSARHIADAKRPPPPPPPPKQPMVAPAPAARQQTLAETELRHTVLQARAWIRDKQYAQAMELLTPINHNLPRDVRLLALEGYARMMNRDFAGAQTLAETALATDEWSNDAIVLSGLIAKWQNRPEEAARMFQRAAYNRIDCWPAHYYLGEVYRIAESGDWRRCYRVALQCLKKKPDPDGGLVLPLDLPLADVRMLCAHHGGGEPAMRE